MRERKRCLTLLLLRFIFDRIFDPKKVDFFALYLFPVEFMSNATCDLVLFLKSKGFNILKYTDTVPF